MRRWCSTCPRPIRCWSFANLLGHSSVLTTEKYLRRLDTTRIYREAYEQAGIAHGLLTDGAAEHEADVEFGGDDDACTMVAL